MPNLGWLPVQCVPLSNLLASTSWVKIGEVLDCLKGWSIRMGLEHVIKVPLEGRSVTLLPFPSCSRQGIRKRPFSPPFRCWCPTFPVSSSSPSCAFPRLWFKCLSSDGSPLQPQPWSWAKTHRSVTHCFRPGVRTPAKPPKLRELLRALSSALGLQIRLPTASTCSPLAWISVLDMQTLTADFHSTYPLGCPHHPLQVFPKPQSLPSQ